WALLTLSLGAVWITECLNTAIEATINLESPEPHPMAKIGKDVAATASLVASAVFVIIVILILLPRLFDRLALPGT
ncbi:MAG: diacylglycerol kinase family protein, partial [Anaerolineae bacterium]|nr:diacylglycerol kinase family protein [Anaerolineae bacterium]